MACAYEELGQADENVTDEFGNGAVEIDGKVTRLNVEVGGYGNGDVSDFAHRLIPFVSDQGSGIRDQRSAISDQWSGISGQWRVIGWAGMPFPAVHNHCAQVGELIGKTEAKIS